MRSATYDLYEKLLDLFVIIDSEKFPTMSGDTVGWQFEISVESR
jgi:hypothetical protein